MTDTQDLDPAFRLPHPIEDPVFPTKDLPSPAGGISLEDRSNGGEPNEDFDRFQECHTEFLGRGGFVFECFLNHSFQIIEGGFRPVYFEIHAADFRSTSS